MRTNGSATLPTYLNRKQAARYIEGRFGAKCAPQTLAKYACEGGGPYFQKFNRCPIYTTADLDLWVLSKMRPVQTSFEAPQAITAQFIIDMGGDPFAPLMPAPVPSREGDVDLE